MQKDERDGGPDSKDQDKKAKMTAYGCLRRGGVKPERNIPKGAKSEGIIL